MHIETQFSILLMNKPGVLSQILNALAKEKINIVAITMMDSIEHGMLRVVTTKPAQTRKALEHLNVMVNESEVLSINLSNKSGALADVATLLSEAHINIGYAYCTAGARGGRTTGIFKVADLKKAMKVLEKNTKKKPAKKEKILRAAPTRKAR
ncbi:MAG: ACT domain-containing protein [Planctomycetes bacterium]|nr:ACT domain-containing protein [Planctomycetota bacterium]